MLMNAYVLYTLHDATNHKKLPQRYSSLDFIADWLAEICEPDDEASSDSGSASSDDVDRLDRRITFWNSDKGRDTRLKRSDGQYHCLYHAADKFRSFELDGDEAVRNDLRRLCRYCGTRTIYFCDVCKVPLCHGDCCKKFHTERIIPSRK
jgi:hypothetical protein